MDLLLFHFVTDDGSKCKKNRGHNPVKLFFCFATVAFLLILCFEGGVVTTVPLFFYNKFFVINLIRIYLMYITLMMACYN